VIPFTHEREYRFHENGEVLPAGGATPLPRFPDRQNSLIWLEKHLFDDGGTHARRVGF
jgi:hypothetical protein